jgi:pyruvate formate lyase activating enzyme
MQDFPDHTACILWFWGCNFRCGYCHNPEFVIWKKNKKLTEENVMDFLLSRKGLLDGVVFSGGECTIYPHLENLIAKIKEMGFLIKLDSNGTNPQKIKSLIEKNLLDYVAIDYKAPKEKFFEITKYKKFSRFEQSLKILCENKVPFEVRTTIHLDLMQEEDVNKIIKDLEEKKFKGKYFLQNFIDGESINNLAPPQRKIDAKKINKPVGFELCFRNF